MRNLCLQRVSAEIGHRMAIHNIQICWEKYCNGSCLYFM